MLASDGVQYSDEPVALVVAETSEAARAAAGLIDVHYASGAGIFDLERAARPKPTRPKRTNAGFPTDSALGDFEGAFAAAPVQDR